MLRRCSLRIQSRDRLLELFYLLLFCRSKTRQLSLFRVPVQIRLCFDEPSSFRGDFGAGSADLGTRHVAVDV